MDRWKYDLEEYIRQGEPDKSVRSGLWKTAIGLQDVDKLKTSEYLLDTAKEHIEGKIDIQTAKKRIQSYYEQRTTREQYEDETEEADIVAVRIAEILSENTFQLSPVELKTIHRRLFSGLIKNAGSFREYNISKKEWVLNGASVIYASYDSIQDTLDYDFSIEKDYSYSDLSVTDSIRHIARFVSGIWQIHPFCEGNTRTTAVFAIKYLKTFGFTISNDIFSENSWYFRNALVRANYNNLNNGIHETSLYLEMFFENLLLGKENNLKNRYLHVNFQSDTNSALKGQNVTLDVTLDKLAVLNIIKEKPNVTQKQLAELIGVSDRTIKRRITALKDKGILRRENGKRNGVWIVDDSDI